MDPDPAPEAHQPYEWAASMARFLAEHCTDREIVIGPDLSVRVSPAPEEA